MGRRTIRTMYDALKARWAGFPSLILFKCKAGHQSEVTDLIVPYGLPELKGLGSVNLHVRR